MSQEFLLFDLAGKGRNFCWSNNAWKARAVLNYKKVPYQTEWLELPDITPRLKGLGIPPNDSDEWAQYTIPTVRFPDGSYVMGSNEIVERLEQMYPEPSLRLDNKLRDELSGYIMETLMPTAPYILPRIRRELQSEVSAAWAKPDRERRFGMPEEQWEKEKGGVGVWDAAQPGRRKLLEFVKSHKQDEGPFILGSKVSYEDFVLAGVLEMFQLLGGEPYEKLVGNDESLIKLREACQPWMERKDH